MKIVQTFWTKPGLTGGWPSLRANIMSWALSSMRLSEYYEELELVTDERGSEVLSKIDLPYKHVKISLDDALNDVPTYLWALAKQYTYSLQDVPFIHVDSDVFIWDKLNYNGEESAIFFQNIEIDTDIKIYEPLLNAVFQKGFSNVPHCLSNKYFTGGDIIACNMGVFGGIDLDFVRSYCQISKEFTMSNLTPIENLENRNYFNIIVEQLLLQCLLEEMRVSSHSQLPNLVSDLHYPGISNFWDIPSRNYVHSVHSYKKDPNICSFVERFLLHLYPDIYRQALEVSNYENMKLSKTSIAKPITVKEFPLTKELIRHSELHFVFEDLDKYLRKKPTSEDDKFIWYERIADCYKFESTLKRISSPTNQVLQNEMHSFGLVFGYLCQDLNPDQLSLTINLQVEYLQTINRWWKISLTDTNQSNSMVDHYVGIRYDPITNKLSFVELDYCQLVLLKYVQAAEEAMSFPDQIREISKGLNLDKGTIKDQLIALCYYGLLCMTYAGKIGDKNSSLEQLLMKIKLDESKLIFTDLTRELEFKSGYIEKC